jgi:single-strand DNA-binding protein
MFDTNIVVIGNVLTAPEWRRTTGSNTLVANFRVASTARRMDRDTGRWVDGNHLRVRVNCWRRLAEGVASSITVGDPVVVAGRLYTRDWTDSEGNLRTTYEMEAVSVGHDLSRGRARFFRTKSAATAAVENPESVEKVRGEPAAPVSEDDAPAVYGDGVPEGDEPVFEELPARSPDGLEPVAALPGGGFEPFDTTATPPVAGSSAGGTAVAEAELGIVVEPVAAEPLSSGPASVTPESESAGNPRRVRGRGPRRQPVAA